MAERAGQADRSVDRAPWYMMGSLRSDQPARGLSGANRAHGPSSAAVGSRPRSIASAALLRSMSMSSRSPRVFGLGRGKVFPAADARSLINPLRRLVQSPRRTVDALGLEPDSAVIEIGC